MAVEMKTELLIPAYFDAKAIWDTVLGSNLDKLGGVIINPNSGPGQSFDHEYLKLCTRLRKARVNVLGYVSTRWGERPTEEILEEIETYAKWYGVNDMFLDEAATGEEMLSVYKDIYESINGLVVLNPGVVPHKGYLDVGDVIVVFESDVAKLKGLKMPAWVSANRDKMCYIVMNCPTTAMPSALKKASINARYVYITNGKYDVLPKYWSALLRAIK